MEHDDIREALLRWGQQKCPPSLIGRIISLFRKSPEPPSLLQSCVKVGNEIVAKACIYLGREVRVAPNAPLPADYHLIVAYCFMVGALISASIEEDNAVDDLELLFGICHNLLARHPDDERNRMVDRAWGVAQDVMALRDENAHEWKRLLALGVDGYITGRGITTVVTGGYPELFGNLLRDLIASQREPG